MKVEDISTFGEYKQAVIDTINSLIDCRHKLFGNAITIAMQGELREINKVFDEGEAYKFELTHLKDLLDPNVRNLVSLIEEIQKSVDLLINENSIDDEDINWDGNDSDLEELNSNNETEVDRYFNETSLNKGKNPVFTIIMGGVCVGKTKLRNEKYVNGFVLIDAAEIFLSLCDGDDLDFPSVHQDQMDQIGSAICFRAFTERRNIVTEIIGANKEDVKVLISAIKSMGYKVNVVTLIGDVSETWERNVKRDMNNISAFYCESYHMQWILSAIRKL